ncbi:MAG: hypothetical protein QM723_25415 [Myxococcaceae bacterium]
MTKPILAGALLTLMSGACKPATPCNDMIPDNSGGLGGAGGMAIAPEGGQISVVVSIHASVNVCGGDDATNVSAAAAVVTGPDGQSVAATATPPGALNGDPNGEVATSVTFTPPAPGTYRVDVHFTPRGGHQSATVFVVIDSSGQQPRQLRLSDSTGAVDCTSLDLHENTALCLENGGPVAHLVTLSDAGVVSSVPATTFSLSEGVVWVFDPIFAGVKAYDIDLAGQLFLRSSRQLDSFGNARLIGAGKRGLFVQGSGFAQLSLEDDGGIDVVRSLPITPDDALVQWLPDVGVVSFLPNRGLLCAYSLAGELDGGCTDDAGTAIGFDEQGIWWMEPQSDLATYQLHVTGWHAGNVSASTSALTFVSSMKPTEATREAVPESSPLLYTGLEGERPADQLYLPDLHSGAVYLVRYPFIDPATHPHADSKRLWFVKDGVLTWWQR